MKLTKTGLQMFQEEGSLVKMTDELIDEILKNQEDAEKLEDACNDAAMQLMRAQKAEAIVSRLKKRIEELQDHTTFSGHSVFKEYQVREELQKILGEEK